MEVASVVSEYVPEFLYSFFENVDDHPWICAAVASVLVGLSGILPLLIIPVDESATFKDGRLYNLHQPALEQRGGVCSVPSLHREEANTQLLAGASTLRVLLSFAVGGLLGDVFLHLLPEAWAHDIANTKEGEHVSMRCGLWCLCGMLAFIVVEKLFAPEDDDHQESEHVKPHTNGVNKQVEIEEIDKLLEKERQQRGKYSSKVEGAAKLPVSELTAKQIYESCVFNNNSLGDGSCCGAKGDSSTCGRGRWMGRCLLKEARDNTPHTQRKHVSGYLNLMANSVDNFTHGLAVGGSFLVGARVGLLTTFAILVHEIPHEVGDFAILLKSGFTRWEAAKAQLATAAAGLVGAMTAVVFSGASSAIEAKTSWIGPFTAGGFLHIALVTVLPELVKETPRDSLLHLVALLAGLGSMAAMTHYFH